MKAALASLIGVLLLVVIAYVGGSATVLKFFFGCVLPLLAIVIFLGGMCYRVYQWALSPVPFRIPTTCGQQKSLPFIKHAAFEAPSNTLEVVGRMFLEVVFFRSLFRNSKATLTEDKNFVFGSDKWLWVAAMAFHWSFLIIFLRHFRLFLEPVPFFVGIMEYLDGFMEIGFPVIYITNFLIFGALGYLLLRRFVIPQVRYISLTSDYFALFLLLGVVTTGALMRYVPVLRVDVIAVKELATGLFTMSWVSWETMAGIGSLFFVHLFLICVLLAYFPFSKLLHAAGVFMSPTRNLANNSRERRHVNPWDYPVEVHSYKEWEKDFHDKIVGAGLPLDKD